jgi:hypothetical protein
MGENNYAKELDVAVRVVHMACSLCQRVQEGLVSSTSNDHVKSKDDDSLVTVAGNSIFFYFSFVFFFKVFNGCALNEVFGLIG